MVEQPGTVAPEVGTVAHMYHQKTFVREIRESVTQLRQTTPRG